MQLNLFGFEHIKRCGTCEKVLPICEFYTSKNTKDGFRWQCKKCYYLATRKYKIKTKEKWQKYYKLWGVNNKDKLRKSRIKYYKNNRELCVKRVVNANKKKYNNDEFYRFKHNLRTNIYRSFRYKNLSKNSKVKDILCADWDTVKKHIENQFTDNMSWDNFDQIHIDHKIPLAAASTEFEVIALNHYTNLQPLWAEDNIRKSDKYDPEDFKIYMEWYRKNIKTDA